MFGLDYMMVGGYIYNGATLCCDCGEKRRLPVRYSVSVARLRAHWYPDGLTCDDCMEWIVEPAEDSEEEEEDA